MIAAILTSVGYVVEETTAELTTQQSAIRSENDKREERIKVDAVDSVESPNQMEKRMAQEEADKKTKQTVTRKEVIFYKYCEFRHLTYNRFWSKSLT